jgi:hypothetical protein
MIGPNTGEAYSTSVALTSGEIVITGLSWHDTFTTGAACALPANGLPSCGAGFGGFSHPPVPYSNSYQGNGYAAAFRLATKTIRWSTFIGSTLPVDIAASDNDVYIAAQRLDVGGPALIPLLERPDFYGDTDPSQGTGDVVLGFGPSGQIIGGYFGSTSPEQLLAIATTPTADRVYLAGNTNLGVDFPYHDPVPGTSWYVDVPSGWRDAFYAQIRLDMLQVGTEEIGSGTANAGLLLYPNPASDRLTVEVPEGVQGAIFRVYDQLGQQVSVAVISSNGVRVSLDVSQLCPGPYHIQVLDGRGKVRAATFIR